MIKFLLTLLAFSAISYSYSQGTEVEYNYHTEEFTFYKIIKKKDTTYRKRINRPYAYKDIPTKVTIKELNTFYYDVKMTTESHKVVPVNGDESVEMLGKNFTEGFGAFTDLVDEVKGNDIYKSLMVDGKFQGLEGLKKAFGYGSNVTYLKEKDYLYNSGQKLESLQADMQETSKELKVKFEKILLVEFVNSQLEKLQKKGDLTRSKMNEQAKDLIDKILLENITLEGVISESNSLNTGLKNSYGAYNRSYSAYNNLRTELVSYITQLTDEVGDDPFSEFLGIWTKEMNYDYSETSMNKEVLDHLVDEHNITKIRDDYLKAFENYEEIKASDFEYVYSVNTSDDITVLTMEFVVESDNSDSSRSEQPVKTRELILPTKGGLRINSSAGVSFLRFFNGHDTHTSDDGTVRAVSGDAFRPALTTMFHFYRQTYRPVTVGGSFGVSVPMEGDKDFIYMLGSSFIFGKGQRVILNVGAFGGKIERLSGVSVGDLIPTGAIIPTKKVFDFGMYVGITLNINKLF